MSNEELKNAIEYIEDFIEYFKYDCQHQKETNSAISTDDEEFKETLKILENIRDELKAQKTPKKYLAYDDLKELESDKYYTVKMNDTDYEMVLDRIGKISIGVCLMYDDNAVMKVYLDDYYTDKQFFNDLHLELVEEK